MTKVLVSLDDALLRRVDRRAAQLGLSRSAYLAELAQRDLGTRNGALAAKRKRALARLDRMFADRPAGDVTAIVRRMRDER